MFDDRWRVEIVVVDVADEIRRVRFGAVCRLILSCRVFVVVGR